MIVDLVGVCCLNKWCFSGWILGCWILLGFRCFCCVSRRCRWVVWLLCLGCVVLCCFGFRYWNNYGWWFCLDLWNVCCGILWWCYWIGLVWWLFFCGWLGLWNLECFVCCVLLVFDYWVWGLCLWWVVVLCGFGWIDGIFGGLGYLFNLVLVGCLEVIGVVVWSCLWWWWLCWYYWLGFILGIVVGLCFVGMLRIIGVLFVVVMILGNFVEFGDVLKLFKRFG